MDIRITSTRGASKFQIVTKGRYVSFVTAGINLSLPQQPIQPTTDLKTFWLSALALVTAQVEALP